ncbi:hypothetical protein N7456_010871 [Penicillium angulare]|uniref:Protein kinase domain-containing protein n=1 Tax=Penicillium angulare TaxID=116970 RepID=A0A9W9JZI8_9EURO|nr:hypothetical protein N7456_010871 [Penicillium angulare]
MADIETPSGGAPDMATPVATAPQNPKSDDTPDFGDFVSNEDEEGDMEAYAEPWYNYDAKETSSVYCPICVGEVLNERYLVEHKLGSGTFSTVWMAHDLVEKRDVALKVMRSGEDGDYEIRIQDEIIQNVQDTSHLVTYLATLSLPQDSPCHKVLVLPLMGPCIAETHVRSLSMVTRMSAARQLLEALESLHNAGYVHRGKWNLHPTSVHIGSSSDECPIDLNERNCMWGMAPLHDLDRSAKYKEFGRPLKETITIVGICKPGERVKPMEIPETLRTEEFYLADFGLAMKLGDPITQPGCPPVAFCSPDRLHGMHPSFACDMWSYMAIFTTLYLGAVPFHSMWTGGIISSIVSILGPLPEEWKEHNSDPRRLDSWYDQSQTPAPHFDLESVIARFRPDADPAERELVQSILTKVFIFCPEKRLTATQLLQDPSFRALMDKYGC